MHRRLPFARYPLRGGLNAVLARDEWRGDSDVRVGNCVDFCTHET
ncbi:MAG: hypothetical protein QOJ71_2505, partial [Actinomycetota bacterium]|nr:hypothetical protein [Actinomycetota bacterium]